MSILAEMYGLLEVDPFAHLPKPQPRVSASKIKRYIRRALRGTTDWISVESIWLNMPSPWQRQGVGKSSIRGYADDMRGIETERGDRLTHVGKRIEPHENYIRLKPKK